MQLFKVDFYNFYSSASLESINLHLGIYKSAPLASPFSATAASSASTMLVSSTNCATDNCSGRLVITSLV